MKNKSVLLWLTTFAIFIAYQCVYSQEPPLPTEKVQDLKVQLPEETASDEQIQPPAIETKKPRLVCEEPTHNFGSMDNSQSVEHTFIIKNEGDAVLEINRVKPACGCTVTKITDKQLDPGESSEIPTRLSLRGRNGMQRKSITIFSNDPEKPQFRLMLEGKAVAELSANPPRLSFNQIAAGEVVAKTCELRSQNKSFNIVKIDSTVKEFDVEYEVIETNRAYKIICKSKPSIKEGNFNGQLRVTTDLNTHKVVTIPIHGRVVGSLVVSPEKIVLAQQDNVFINRFIVVSPGLVKEFKITEVQVPDPTIEYVIQALGSNGYRIELKNIQANTNLDGKIVRILTDAEENLILEVPFQIITPKRQPITKPVVKQKVEAVKTPPMP